MSIVRSVADVGWCGLVKVDVPVHPNWVQWGSVASQVLQYHKKPQFVLKDFGILLILLPHSSLELS